VAVLVKQGAAQGSALPDPVKDQAALAPVPQQAIENKPAPGQTGPKGMSPRTTYSRINTGSPPTMDAGGMGQKNGPNLGMQFLPAKTAAQRGFHMTTTMQERPSLQDLVKASMAGTNQKLAVQVEAARQERQKTASAAPPVSRDLTGHVATEVCTKLAEALGFIERELLKEADYDTGPGKGPGALDVMQATSSETNIDAGQTGQATGKNQPPQTPALQPEQVQQGNAGTGLQTNDNSMLPGYPADGPIKNGSANLEASNRARFKKLSFAITQTGHDFDAKLNEMKARHVAERMALGEEFGAHRFGGDAEVPAEAGGAAERLLNIARFGTSELAAGGDPRHLEYTAAKHREGSNAWNPFGGMLTPSSHETGGTQLQYGKYHNPEGKGAPAGKGKEASALVSRIRKVASTIKVAEDAINPAQISAGTVIPAEPPPGAAPQGEQVPSEPADVTSQKRLISSNEAAINYTKGEAKANPKSDVAQVLTEPPLSSATDKVLAQAFDATGRAGVKISSAGVVKTAQQVGQIGATRVLLGRLLKEASAPDLKDGKDKRSTGMAPTTPQSATGANAATMGM
jgi:hypothetical protein